MPPYPEAAGRDRTGPEIAATEDGHAQREMHACSLSRPPFPRVQAVTTTSRTRAWPAPLCGGHRSAAKSRRLWGVPVAAIAKGPPPVVSQLSR